MGKLSAFIGWVFLVFMSYSSSLYAGQGFEQPAYVSNFSISYSDLDKLLDKTVWKNGSSTRKYAGSLPPAMGTRITAHNPNPTRLEGNRVLFHLLKDPYKPIIRAMRASLENLPSEMPLKNFSPNEQLAYWLNMHNIAVYEAILEDYPISNLKRFIAKLSDEKRLTIAGTKMSIRDIETLVMDRWKSPLVIYGFYLGNIGAPDLRKKAYTAETVWDDLTSNAKNFAGGLRGLQFDGDRMKVSVFYERMKTAFPNFEEDLKNHLTEIIKPLLAARVYPLNTLKTSVKDWQIADMYNGHLRTPGSSTNTNPANFIMSLVSGEAMETQAYENLKLQQYPEHVRVFVREIRVQNKLRAKLRMGIVTIDEVESNEQDVPASEKKGKKKGKKKKKN